MTYLAKVNPRRKHNGLFPGHFDSLINDIFNKSIGEPRRNQFTNQRPAVNVSELEDKFELEVAVPGLKKDDITLKVEDETLVISATKEEKTAETKGNYTRREFDYGTFSRSFQLNETIDAENIQASFEDGILKVVLPKVEEEVKDNNRVIEIA